jgi:hypothetical protein
MGSSRWKISTKPPSSEGSFFINIGICSYYASNIASHPSPIISDHVLARRRLALRLAGSFWVVFGMRFFLILVFWVIDGLVALGFVLVLDCVDDVIRDGPGRAASPKRYLSFRPRIYS